MVAGLDLSDVKRTLCDCCGSRLSEVLIEPRRIGARGLRGAKCVRLMLASELACL